MSILRLQAIVGRLTVDSPFQLRSSTDTVVVMHTANTRTYADCRFAFMPDGQLPGAPIVSDTAVHAASLQGQRIVGGIHYHGLERVVPCLVCQVLPIGSDGNPLKEKVIWQQAFGAQRILS